jgi:hypothetical protein
LQPPARYGPASTYERGERRIRLAERQLDLGEPRGGEAPAIDAFEAELERIAEHAEYPLHGLRLLIPRGAAHARAHGESDDLGEASG